MPDVIRARKRLLGDRDGPARLVVLVVSGASASSCSPPGKARPFRSRRVAPSSPAAFPCVLLPPPRIILRLARWRSGLPAAAACPAVVRAPHAGIQVDLRVSARTQLFTSSAPSPPPQWLSPSATHAAQVITAQHNSPGRELHPLCNITYECRKIPGSLPVYPRTDSLMEVDSMHSRLSSRRPEPSSLPARPGSPNTPSKSRVLATLV